MRAFMFSALAAMVASTSFAPAADAPFSHGAAVKALGYDPEAIETCKTYKRIALPDMITPENAMELFLRMVGEDAAERAACPKLAKPDTRSAPTKDAISASYCVALAKAAGGPITEHVSEMMSTYHPDVVAAYADGVARALASIRDTCAADRKVWAKVATQALLFANRATTLREGRVCALWRIALDKELKAATAAGQAKGKAAGVARFQLQVKAALDGAHHFCGDDSASGLIDANVDLTKMLLESMPDK